MSKHPSDRMERRDVLSATGPIAVTVAFGDATTEQREAWLIDWCTRFEFLEPVRHDTQLVVGRNRLGLFQQEKSLTIH